MIQYIVGHEIFTGVLTYRNNLSVVWKTMLSVFLFVFLFLICLRLFLLLRTDFCDIQPSTHFFDSVSFTPHCIAFQSTLVWLSAPIDASISLRVTKLLFYNRLWIQHLTRKFHGDIFFQIEYFCGADGKKKAKIPNFWQRGNSLRPM